MYNCKRNDFADDCLKQELGWIVKMTRGIPALFQAVQASLNHHFRIVTDLSLPSSTSGASGDSEP